MRRPCPVAHVALVSAGRDGVELVMPTLGSPEP
jgi:hypothetical protein